MVNPDLIKKDIIEKVKQITKNPYKNGALLKDIRNACKISHSTAKKYVTELVNEGILEEFKDGPYPKFIVSGVC